MRLYNTTGSAMTLTGWYLSNSGLNLQKFHIPDGTVIQANGYAVFTQDGDFGKAGDPNGFFSASRRPGLPVDRGLHGLGGLRRTATAT